MLQCKNIQQNTNKAHKAMYRYCLIHCFLGLKKALQGIGKFPTLAPEVMSLMSRLGLGFKE